MQYRKLGASDLHVSEISLGSWLTYGAGVERAAAALCVDRALDLGINLFDTANVYGGGAAELVLGEVLSGRPRDSYLIATKLWGDMGGGNYGLSRAQIEKQLNDSLKRLRTDYIDLYQCHRYDRYTPLEETMEALTRAKQSGKVRWSGFSEWSPQNIEDSLAVDGVEHFVSSQPQYSLLHRRIEKKVIPVCAANGISQIVWSPLGQGILTGKYLPGAAIPEHTRASSEAMGESIRSRLEPHLLAMVQKLKLLAQEASCTLAQFALAWVLRQQNVASAIVGASQPEQLDENAGASGIIIDPALFEKAELIV